jgi:hypothetical protein
MYVTLMVFDDLGLDVFIGRRRGRKVKKDPDFNIG